MSMSAVDTKYLNWARCIKGQKLDYGSIQCDRLNHNNDVRVAIYCFGEVTPRASRSWGVKPDFGRSTRPPLRAMHNKLRYMYAGHSGDEPTTG
jgi:hypothetical protein